MILVVKLCQDVSLNEKPPIPPVNPVIPTQQESLSGEVGVGGAAVLEDNCSNCATYFIGKIFDRLTTILPVVDTIYNIGQGA